MTVDFRERVFVSQYAQETLGLRIFVQGVPTDATASVQAAFFNEAIPDPPVFQRAATHASVGVYEILLTSPESAAPGNYTLVWEYDLGGVQQRQENYLVIGEAQPAYDNLVPGMKQIADDVWIKFSDLFDSPTGGPNLMTYFQTHWGRGRLAQLLRGAVGRLNTAAQPYMTYSLDGDGGSVFPIDAWGALLTQALYVEALKHLVRSYVEQPAFIGGSVTRLDRRDYMDRWKSILDMEEPLLQRELEVFKIRHMGFGRPQVLVSGGTYGRFGPTRIAGSVAARPRYWSRFF